MSTKRKAEIHSRVANRPRLMKSGGSRTDSERDSGFSDASSEHMSAMDTTDSEDSPHPVQQQQQGPQTSGSGPQPSQLAVVGGSYSNLSPMIIMNNVLLKQPGDNPPALKPWGFSPTVEVVQQPQVVFLQPVVSRQASTASKDSTSRHRRPKKYLPILKSYPKIAPHPGDSSGSSGRGTASSSSFTSSSSSPSPASSSSSSFSSSSTFSSSFSSSSGSERCSTLTSSHREHCQREKQQKSVNGGAVISGSTTPSLPAPSSTMSPLLQSRLSFPTTESCSSPARERPSSAMNQTEFMSSLSFSHTTTSSKDPGGPQTQENIPAEDCNLSDGEADSKRKRFCNTYNILSKSGLLDITLRTKELLRQNRRTQTDLDRLKNHTDLFLQAVRSGDTSICVKLQARLQEEDREKEKERAVQAGSKGD
ncbi:CLOCK-interacting pacemaker [Acanthochromis polyacanthus]|uniref:CLOCK-interacting pacemaker b n=1 Tax=Acanthochromis polyacanthus TaxID=80966 RepID=A0A3Q1GM88_9TELE|nr:CLOCK-interacting pacemaker [Acanthochromis polyacanthus]XP_022050133.1 CLOCK-interacting pacemaker [Acanthochromis polyacanthus]